MDDHALLLCARNALKALHLPAHIQELPTPPEECIALQGRKILLIDDSPEVFEVFVPLLTAATHGSAVFLLHHGESMVALVEQITALHPEILLVDQYLGRGVRGHEVVAALQEAKIPCRVFGFSSEAQLDDLFCSAGAEGAIEKDVRNPENALRTLSALV